MSCPDEKTLKLFIVGRLTAQQVEEFEKHLETCPACSERLAELEAGANIPILDDIREAHQSGSESGTLGDSSTISPDMPRSIDHYNVLDVLGSGGMGTVYSAENPHLDRKVAIKVVKSSRRIHQSSIDRFSREMKAAGKLHHPNIVQALDGGLVDGQPYLVMEYLEGCDLSRYVKEHGPLQVEQACNIIRQAATGLDYAHRLGYVHRDVKPTNLWLMSDGTVKILDFGLVRVLEQKKDERGTAPEEILGSPDYISPEQITDSKQADNRSDIYSLGCTFYYLLTGEPPFGKETHPTTNDKFNAHVKEPFPPLDPCRKDIPKTVDQLLRQMVAKQPEQRPQSASAIVHALEKREISRFFGLVAVFLIATLLVTAGYALTAKDNRTAPPPNQAVVAPVVADDVIAPEAPKEFPVVRMTLEIGAENKGYFRVEKGLSTDPPDDSFQGEPFTHSVFPHASVSHGKKGMGRIIWGFGDPLEAWERYNTSLAVLQSIAEIKDGALQTYFGGGSLGIWNARLPIRVSCDFPDIHKREELQIQIGGGVNSQYGRFVLIVKCKENETYDIEVWLETASVTYGSEIQTPGTLKPVTKTTLEQPVEQSFQLNDTLRNADVVVRRQGGQVAPITRVDIAAKFVIWAGFTVKQENDVLAVNQVADNTVAKRVGLEVGDIIERIDGKECTEAEAKRLIQSFVFGDLITLDILRNGERKTIRFHLD